MRSFLMPLISNCPMMPAWHQCFPMSVHVDMKSQKQQNIADIRDFHVSGQSIFPGLDYLGYTKDMNQFI